MLGQSIIRRRTSRTPCAAQSRIAALMSILLLAGGQLLLSIPASAQSAWELTPYRVKVVLATPSEGRFTARQRQDFATELVMRTDTQIGAAWELSCVDAPASLRGAILAAPENVTFAELSELSSTCDKLVLLSLAPNAAGYAARLCEWDVETQQPGKTVGSQIPRAALADGVFRLLLDAFTPLAKIDSVDIKSARLKFRAGELVPRTESIQWVKPGEIFRAVLRTNDRDGGAKQVQPLEWTYLIVTELQGTQAVCKVYSGLRSPLSRRRRGRTEQYALALPPAEGSTRLLVRSRTAPDRALTGYDVYAYGPDSKETIHLGRTGREGAIEIPPGAQPLRILLVQHGGALLARLPIVPGAASELTAFVPDDDLRLEAEGLIVSMQENLVDLVVRRAILVTQARNRIDDGKLDEAKVFIDELRRMRTQQQFLRELEQERQRIVSDDAAVQKQIDKLFDDTTKLLGNYLIPRELETLEKEWNEARSGKPANPAPKPVSLPPASLESPAPAGQPGNAPQPGNAVTPEIPVAPAPTAPPGTATP